MKKIIILVYIIFITFFSAFTIIELRDKNEKIKEKETQILEYSYTIDSLMNEKKYFLDYLENRRNNVNP